MEGERSINNIISRHLDKVKIFIEDFDENLDDTHEDEHHIISVLDDFTENLEDEFCELYEMLKCESTYIEIKKVHEYTLNRLHDIKQDYVLNEDIDVDNVVAEFDTWFIKYKKYFHTIVF